MTLGVPRIKEVIHCTREPKTVNTFIYLNLPYLLGSEDELINFKKAWIKRGEVLQLLVRDAIRGYDIIFDPEIRNSVVVQDQELELLYSLVHPDYNSSLFSEHVIRLEFNATKLAEHGLNFGSVCAVLRETLGDGTTTACVHSDPDSLQPVFRIRARYASAPTTGDDENWQRLEQSTMQRFYQQQVESIRLGGIENVRNVYIREDKREGVLMLDTDCRDLQRARAVKDSISERCECNHPLEVYRTLGVEAARQSIIIEIRRVYRYYGINVDARHLTLIADAMTYAGGMMSIDRHGINHAEFNTLKKAAFEEIADVLTKAAVTAKCDPLCDNTSRIMIGQEVRVGTGTFDLMLDRNKHEQLSKMYHQPRRQQGRVQRRKRAIADRMADIDRQFAGHVKPTANDPLGLKEFDGSGFGYAADEYDPERPFGLGYGEEEFYSPKRTSEHYSPASPRYSPTLSPLYSPSHTLPNYDAVYDPTMPDMMVERIPMNQRPYDPTMLDLWKDNDDDAYDPNIGF